METKNKIDPSRDIKKDEPRMCPRYHGSKVDPHHYQDDCQRCGGTGEVTGPEKKFVPYPFVD